MSDVDTLFQYALEYLNAVLAALATTDAGVPDGPFFVAPSVPALDCPEMVTVHVQTVGWAPTSPSSPPLETDMRARRRGVIQATLVAQFVRCQPNPSGINAAFPDPASMTAAAKKSAQDVWAVWNHLTTEIRNGTIFNGSCPPNGIDSPAPIQTQGGSAGWAFQVRPQIDGYGA